MEKFVWQKHGFGTRQANPPADVSLRQVHSACVRDSDGLADREAEGNALVTAKPGRSIGVRTADCVPLLLLDAQTRAVAAIHAGWRGTAARIAGETVKKLTEGYGTDAEQVYAAIGPCIRACCYEVSPDVAERFREWPESVVVSGSGKPRLDLAGVNRNQLIAAGVPPLQIFDCGLCTFCLPDQFFSFRREPENPGRMLSAICR
ncbi:MAG: peptidoglycan editing factor PgeF, partial [Acidobacteriota bacterium]|nr:peptidoglycan editing factor PgeF [Acidobacteriota bacterium]